MPVKMLFIDFRLNLPPAEYVQAMKPPAPDFLNLPGLRWRIWLVDETQRKAGGIVLEVETAVTYGPLGTGVRV